MKTEDKGIKEVTTEEKVGLQISQYEQELQNARNNLVMWNTQVERLIGAIAALKELFPEK